MRIAITQRVVTAGGHGERRDALSQDWARYLALALPGVALLPVPNYPEGLDSFLGQHVIEGAVFSNGNDWGEAPERDETERRLLVWCRTRRVPVLGVCRGLQALNLLLGGRIEPIVEARTGERHAAVDHEVSVSGDAFVGLAGAPRITVNSYHRQGVLGDGLAPDCAAFAASGAGLIEGFHHRAEPLLAVQWHPERNNPAAAFDAALLGGLFLEGRVGGAP